MADDAPELLHLLKAGRILQYRQQNVALVSADEGVEFDITYAERWLAPDLDVSVGDGAVIILSDSPYAKIDPARYATVTAAERTRSGLRLTVKVGPWPVVEDPTALRPPNRPHPSGAPFFAWRAPADGMRPPRSDHEAREAWRDVVAGLRGNQFYADSNFARVVRVLDPHGHEVRERRLELGEAATAVIEVHSPGGNDHVHSVLVDSDPPGSVVGGIEKERADGEDHLHVPVRPLAAGTHTVDLSFVPEPLLSTRLSFTIDAHRPSVPAAPIPPGPAARTTDGSAASTVDAALVQGLVQRLSRIDAIDPVQWLDLLVAHVLPLAPDDPLVRSVTAEAAYVVGEYETTIDLLDDPSRFRAGDAFRRLSAGLRYSIPTEVAGLLREIDLGVESNVAQLAKELPRLPDGAVRQIAEVILDQFAGETVLDRLLPDVFPTLRDDLALRVVRECAPADPEAWLRRALDRWPDPHRMPDDALAEILTWDINTPALAPYLREAIEDHVDAGEIDEVLELGERARALLPRVDQVRLRAATARMFVDHETGLDTGRDLLLGAAMESAGLGDPDLATELAFTLRELWPVGDDEEVDTAIDRLRAVLADLDDFRQWREKKDEDAATKLRPALTGKVLHVVGGKRPPWADALETDLGLKDLRWHESERKKQPALDWAGGADTERDIVVLIWTHCGHATARKLSAAGVRDHSAVLSRSGLLEVLAAA
ncbi:MAG: hypothetical protein R8F63_00480 [Acidimicrobiales bacterium]|nr:hypothetical protein [Acidimicrobiales bacterium]